MVGKLLECGWHVDGVAEMSKGPNYKDLEVWQIARQLAADIYALTHKFPQSEQFGITSQLRRAAVSVACNIAEGHGRRTEGYFVQFLRMSIGSLNELETLLVIANDIRVMSDDDLDRLVPVVRGLTIKIQNLIGSIRSKPIGTTNVANN